ncbi:MAG TPA: nuclear transport factor 2 family protein [Ktedonobacteraceae bacterium]
MDNALTPVEVVQRQFDAYNAHDLEAFLATYSPDVEIRSFPDGAFISKGIEEVRASYGQWFEKPTLHARLVSRATLKQFVIDVEEITGAVEGQLLSGIAIYEVVDQLIRRVWLIL